MSKIVIQHVRGGKAGQRQEFDQETITLGRRATNDVAFEPNVDRKASGQHAEIRREGSSFYIHDLGSTTGTYLDGKRLSEAALLTDGCQIELGKDGPLLSVNLLGGVQPSAASAAKDDGAPTLAVTASSPPPNVSAPSPSVPPPSGRTAVYRAMFEEIDQKSSRKMKTKIWVLAGLLVVGAIVGGIFFIKQGKELDEAKDDAQRTADELEAGNEKLSALEESNDTARDRLEELEEVNQADRRRLAESAERLQELRQQMEKAEGSARDQLAEQARALEATRSEYETKLQDQDAALASLRNQENAAEVIAREYEKSLFMLIFRPEGRSEIGFCTAFCIDKDRGILATNAHCVSALQEAQGEGVRSVARMNRDPSKTYYVVRTKSHSDYTGSAFSADVALVKLQLDINGDESVSEDEALPVQVQIASDEEVYELAPGQAIYTMGFPGRVMNEARPAADFRAAVISKVTNYAQAPSSKADTRLIWHSALTTKGTSGSPIFDQNQKVIAVNNGGLSARAIRTTDPRTGQVRTEYAYDASGLNFGIRVDALRELMR